MPLHRLIDIHGCQRRHIKASQPHVHHNGNLHGRIILLEQGSILLVHLWLNHVMPLFLVCISSTCHHVHHVLPVWSQFQHLAVYLHGGILIVGHNHCLSRQFLLAVLFVVVYYVTTKTIYRIGMAKYLLNAAVILASLVDLFLCGTFLSQTVELVIQFLQHLFVQVQVHHTTLVINGTGGPILYSLSHVVHVDVVAKYLLSIAVSLTNGCPCESDERGMGQSLTH